MSEYGRLTTIKPNAQRSLLSYDPIKEKKAARRKLLEEIEQRRKLNFTRWLKKRRLQANSKIDITDVL